MEKGFYIKLKTEIATQRIVEHLHRNPSITPEGEIKFCAMDNQTVIKSLGNVFKEDIGQLFSNNYQLMNMIVVYKLQIIQVKNAQGVKKVLL